MGRKGVRRTEPRTKPQATKASSSWRRGLDLTGPSMNTINECPAVLKFPIVKAAQK